MLTNQAAEQNKDVKWWANPWNQSGRWGKGQWWKGFAEKPSLKFRMKDFTRDESDNKLYGPMSIIAYIFPAPSHLRLLSCTTCSAIAERPRCRVLYSFRQK